MTKEDISNWLAIRLSKTLDINISDIDVTLQFDDYGLDSITAMGLVGDLADWLKQELDPNVIYDHSSIESLSKFIVQEFNLDAS